MIWKFKRKKNREQILHARKTAEAAAIQLREQKVRVNATASWLERRQTQNGFGQDFEYTLRPRSS